VTSWVLRNIFSALLSIFSFSSSFLGGLVCWPVVLPIFISFLMYVLYLYFITSIRHHILVWPNPFTLCSYTVSSAIVFYWDEAGQDVTGQKKNGNGSRRFKYKLQCYDLETDSEIILTITKTFSLVRLFSAVRSMSLRITSHHSLLNLSMVLYGKWNKTAYKEEWHMQP